jgi:hypothetical protein
MKHTVDHIKIVKEKQLMDLVLVRNISNNKAYELYENSN